jgi:hypothetical protein
MAKGKTASSARAKPRTKRARRIYLTPEQQQRIITSLEAGGTLDSAARVAGISARKLRELRQRARSSHPTRRGLPELRSFFDEVDQAIGRRLLANEVWVSTHDPKYALKYLRASLEADGEDEEPPRLPTAAETQQHIDVLIRSGVYRSPRCHQGCPCEYHQPEGELS